jgi:3-keto-L-gulonate-6-phosphate decarboxylase
VTGVQMAFLCYLEPGSFSNPCYLVRRLRRKLPKATIVAGFWTLKKNEIEERNAVTLTGADLVAVSLQQAVEQVVDAVHASTDGHRNDENRPPIPLAAAS